MPENEDLKWATHNNIRRTLFYHVWRSIKYVEFKRLRTEEDYFELEKVEQSEEGAIDRFLDKHYGKEAVSGKLIEVQKWTIDRNGGGDKGEYKVKFYHMDNDEFRGKVYPVSFLDSMRYLWFNRRHFRLL